HEAALGDKCDESGEPLFVIAHAQIFGRGDDLPRVARGVDIPLAPESHGAHHGQHASFPARMEYRLVLFVLNGAHAVHAAHVVHAVHALAPAGGSVTLATPIMASRVTSAAS